MENWSVFNSVTRLLTYIWMNNIVVTHIFDTDITGVLLSECYKHKYPTDSALIWCCGVVMLV